MSVRTWLLSPVLHRAKSVWAGHGLDNAASGATECEGDWAPQWCPPAFPVPFLCVEMVLFIPDPPGPGTLKPTEEPKGVAGVI